MNETDTEHRLAAALRSHDLTTPDADRLGATAITRGTRVRRARQAGVVLASAAAVAVGALGVATVGGGSAAPSPAPLAGAGTTTEAPSTDPRPLAPPPTTPPPPESTRTGDLDAAYAVLVAPGWTAPADQPFVLDEKLYYEGPGEASASLNWRPADNYSVSPQEWGDPVDAPGATIDGDPAAVFGSGGQFVVVGPVREGRFLTLSVGRLPLDEALDLAGTVYRQ